MLLKKLAAVGFGLRDVTTPSWDSMREFQIGNGGWLQKIPMRTGPDVCLFVSFKSPTQMGNFTTDPFFDGFPGQDSVPGRS